MRLMLFVVAPTKYTTGGAIEPPPLPPPYSEPAAYGTQLWGYSQPPPPQEAPMPHGGAGILSVRLRTASIQSGNHYKICTTR